MLLTNTYGYNLSYYIHNETIKYVKRTYLKLIEDTLV